MAGVGCCNKGDEGGTTKKTSQEWRNGGMASWGGQAIREARQPAGLPLPLARDAKEGEGDDGQEEGKLEARNET